MKYHKRITGGQYPIRFDVFLGYGNKDKPALFARLERGLSRSVFKELRWIIENTDLDIKSGWHFCYGGAYVIQMAHFNVNSAHYYGTFQHELHHCVRAAGRHLAFPQSEAAEEFYAYLTGYVTERVYAGLWR
jgi:hypothetical protein